MTTTTGQSSPQNAKSTLIVAFEPPDKISYPHLNAVIEMLGSESAVEYFYFRERGYFITDHLRLTLRSIIRLSPLRLILKIVIDFLHLRQKAKQYDRVVVIDNFTYIFACLCHKNVILWSCDFVTLDQESSKLYIQRQIAAYTRKFLQRNKRIIIQGQDRFDLFKKTLDINVELDCYFLPVSLPNTELIDPFHRCNKKPVLMQVGGINSFRSNSDKLIKAYQSQAEYYLLLLHGFFFSDILSLLKTVEKIPLCSMVEVKPAAMGQLISNCDIGFISYHCTDSNFYYIAYASGQLVEFLRQAKPVIVSGNTDLKDFVGSMGIGIFVDDVEKIPEAIAQIIANYESYSKKSHELFLSTYSLDVHRYHLTQWIAQD